MIRATALADSERSSDELIVWRAAVARARGALSKTFEGKMEAALASFDVVPQHGRGAGGHTLSDFAAAVGISYGALDQYRQVLRWLGDFVHVYEIPSYSLARVAQVSGSLAQRRRVRALPRAHARPPPACRGRSAHCACTCSSSRPGALAGAEGAPCARSAWRRVNGGDGARQGSHLSSVAAKAAKKVEGLIAKGVSTTYPEEQDVCWKKARH